MSNTEAESKSISTRKLRVCLEGQEKDEATEIEVAGDSVSSFMQAIASSGYLTAQPVADFEAITLDDQILKPRQKLAMLDIKEDSVFILKVKETLESDSEKSTNDAEDILNDNFGAVRGRGKRKGRGRGNFLGRGRGRGRGRRSGWRFRDYGEAVFDLNAGAEDVATESLDGFTVARRDVIDKKTGEVTGKEVMVSIVGEELKKILRDELGSQEDQLYAVKPQVTANFFVPFLSNLKERLEREDNPKTSPLKPFVDWLATECKEITEKLEAMLQKGVISFSDLVLYFSKGKKVYVREDVFRQKVAFEILSTRYYSSFFGTFFGVTGSVIFTNGLKYFSVSKSFNIASFQGVKNLEDLPVRELDDKTLEELVERGKKFKNYALGTHHLGYKGAVFRRSYYSLLVLKADGRIMIDGASFKRMSPNYKNRNFVDAESDGGVGSPELHQEDLWRTWPFIYGFAFSAKKWGELNVDWMTPVKYEDTAFDQLVIPADKKELIQALVKYRNQGFSDIISNKGGGCIFLLHGSPGVGKTLTAESIAEFLHKPLYSVSVGELGTSTIDLEERLREILEIASVWDAVVLIDEADIFLEKRTEEDIKRNALVGIFLRLLEYHQGVLFLTTNRVKSFDTAFHSRISVALKYSDLDTNTRERIWDTLLTAANIKACKGADFKAHVLNGRQIKNCIRLSQALAASLKKEVDVALLLRTIRVTLQFEEDLLDSIIADEAFDELLKNEVQHEVKHKLHHSSEIKSH
jgi:DNA polymerase III delta prime subunit